MIIKVSISFIVLMLSASVFTQAAMLKNDPKRPVGKISKDLGIKKGQFVACFNHVKPAPQGKKPTKNHERMNKAVLLPCLQKANKNITNELLDEVMDRYRP